MGYGIACYVVSINNNFLLTKNFNSSINKTLIHTGANTSHRFLSLFEGGI